MLKLLIWCCTLVGLLPVAWLLFTGAATLATAKATEQQVRDLLPSFPGGNIDTHLHDSYFAVGPLRMTWFPRGWAVAAASVGVTLLFVGLVFLLHVPNR